MRIHRAAIIGALVTPYDAVKELTDVFTSINSIILTLPPAGALLILAGQ
jgi:hypothetical protein